MEYEFNNYLTASTADEVNERVQNIFGAPDVFFSVAHTPAGLDVPRLYTHQKAEDIRITQGSGFRIYVKDSVLQFGAHAFYDTVALAHTAEREDREYTFVNIVGGTGQSGLLNQQISIWGRNQYGVKFSTVAKVEDISSKERAEIERAHILAVGVLLRQKYNLDYDRFAALVQEADNVRDNWKSVLQMF